MEKVKKMMCEQNGNFNKEKENLKGKPKRMSRAEKYYNSNEKFTREIQRQICTEKKNQQTRIQDNENNQI